jgi:hypothetical protein
LRRGAPIRSSTPYNRPALAAASFPAVSLPNASHQLDFPICRCFSIFREFLDIVSAKKPTPRRVALSSQLSPAF